MTNKAPEPITPDAAIQNAARLLHAAELEAEERAAAFVEHHLGDSESTVA